jgi:hypothetical protein
LKIPLFVGQDAAGALGALHQERKRVWPGRLLLHHNIGGRSLLIATTFDGLSLVIQDEHELAALMRSEGAPWSSSLPAVAQNLGELGTLGYAQDDGRLDILLLPSPLASSQSPRSGGCGIILPVLLPYILARAVPAFWRST